MNARLDRAGSRFAPYGRVRGVKLAPAWRLGVAFAPRRVPGRSVMRAVERHSGHAGGAIVGVVGRRDMRRWVRRERVVRAKTARAEGTRDRQWLGLSSGDRVRLAAQVGVGWRVKSALRVSDEKAWMVKRRSLVFSGATAPGRADRDGPDAVEIRQRGGRAGLGFQAVAASRGGAAPYRARMRVGMAFAAMVGRGGIGVRAMAPVGREAGWNRDGFSAPVRQVDHYHEPRLERAVRHDREADGPQESHRWRSRWQTAQQESGRAASAKSVQPHDMVRMMGDLFADEGRRPPSGVTGFDGRLSPIFAGRKPGF